MPDNQNAIVTDDMLKLIADNGKVNPSRKRFKSCSAFVSTYRRLADEDKRERGVKRSAVQGLVDGNPPIPHAKLREAGELWRSNFNPRQAEGRRNQSSAALWSLLHNNEMLVEIKSKRPDIDPTEMNSYVQGGRDMSMKVTNILREWSDFFNHEMCNTNDSVTHGIGWLVWFDDYDWHYEHTPHGSVKFPPRTRALIGDMNVIYVTRVMPLSKLIDMAENPASKEMGWNRAAIVKMLIRRYAKKDANNKDFLYNMSEWESAQQRIKNNEFGDDHFTDMEGIPVIYGFVVSPRPNEGVSLYIAENIEVGSEEMEYLCERHNHRKSITECIQPFFYNVGDGFLRSIKGEIAMLYPQLLVSALTINRTVDAATLSGSLILEDTGSNDTRVNVIGPICRLPAGSKPIQSSFAPRLDGFIALYELMDRQMNQNHGGGGQGLSDSMLRQDRITAEQVKAGMEQDMKLQIFQAMIYYSQRDRLYTEVVRRLLTNDKDGWWGEKESKEFREWCKAKNVPEDMMKPENISVRAVRAIGYGSQTAARAAMDRLFNAMLTGAYDQEGAANIVRDYTMQVVGYDIVDRYAPSYNRDEMPNEEASHAILENNDIRQGNQVGFAPEQDHLVHARLPIAMLTQMARAYLDGKAGRGQPVDPRSLLPAFNVGMPHIQQHIEALARSKANSQKAKGLQQQWAELAKVHADIIKDVEAIMQQQQRMAAQEQERMAAEAAQRDPTMRAEARKDAVTQADIQRKDVMAASDIQRKQVKTQVDIQKKVLGMNVDMMNKMGAARTGASIPTVPTEGEM